MSGTTISRNTNQDSHSEYSEDIHVNAMQKYRGKTCHNIISINKVTSLSDGVVEWLKRRTSNLRIASFMGSNPVRDKPLFP